jgi:hypothetical protein
MITFMVFQKFIKTPKKEPPDKPKIVYILNDYTGKQKGQQSTCPLIRENEQVRLSLAMNGG